MFGRVAYRDEIVEQATHLALVDHPTGAAAGRRSGEAAGSVADGQAERVEGTDLGSELGGPGAHLVGGAAVEGHRGQADRLPAPVDDEVAQPLGEHPGLARTGRGDDPCRADSVADRGELVRRQIGLGRSVAGDGERARVDRLTVHHGDASELVGVERLSRASVDVGGCAVRQGDVRRTAWRRTDPLGLAGPPPDRVAGAQVPVVHPHQELESLPGEGERCVELPGLASLALGSAQVGRIAGEAHHHRRAREPVPVQRVCGRRRIGERRLVHRELRPSGARRRNADVRGEDDPASERGWSEIEVTHGQTVPTASDTARRPG